MNFDRVAAIYGGLERLAAGQKMQRCRVAWLAEVSAARRVLIVGEGPGRFLAACARALPEAEILCVDGSAGMLAQARKSVADIPGAAWRIQFQQSMLPDWKVPKEKFDLIVTNFFLDCFNEEQLARVVSLLASAARADALWVVSDFCIPERGLVRCRARLVVGLLYAFFRTTTNISAKRLVTPRPYLETEGFRREERKLFDWGLMYSELWRKVI